MSKIERALTKAERDRRRKTLPRFPSNGNERRVLVLQEGIVEFQESVPEHTQITEHFRRTAARLKSFCENIGARDVLFTSAVSGEGKTTTAINCAISLCQDFNLSVCLIDCDLRNPRISGLFSSNNCPGIIDLLKGEADIEKVVRSTPIKGLSLVTSHKAGRLSLPLLNTERLAHFISDMRNRFDLVVYDSSPVLPVSDSIVLAKYISALVLLVEPGKTRRKHIEQIFEQIDRKKFTGFIMNYTKVKPPKIYGYSKYYDYGY
jgi:capsular exopolysaccharide synthesis family protein